MSIIWTILLTIVIFMVIIMIHEFGHFIAAKSVGVKVHEFSIGFGPAIYKKQGKETLYTVRALPIGGFVKLEGEDEESNDPNALNKKPVWARFIVMAAGATFNIILGLVVYTFIFTHATLMPTLSVERVSADIPNSPAIGVLEPGDKVVAFNGKRLWYYRDLTFLLNTEVDGNPVKLTVLRNGALKEFSITPVQYQGMYFIGFEMKKEPMTIQNALLGAVGETFFVIRTVFYSLAMLVQGKVPITQMSGPVGVGTVVGSAAKQGIPSLFNIFAFLSVNIGIFNLIPFPALDGGRIFFLIIEFFRRKPIPPEKEGYIHFVGLVLLMLLMIVITSSDIYKLFMPKG